MDIGKVHKATSLWADVIVIADQNSTDGSAEIAQSFSKVRLIRNNSKLFNEPDRQKMLVNEARKIPGRKLIIALDADELLTGDFFTKLQISKLSPGTVLYFEWLNVLPGFKKYWAAPSLMPFGYVDDGSPHVGKNIHSHRIPLSKNMKKKIVTYPKILHLQYLDWKRMESKHRWYQSWERINNPFRSAVSIYRQYHHMDAVPKNKIKELKDEWFLEYENRGIDVRNVIKEEKYWWDEEVINYFRKYGCKFFARIGIWKGWQGFDDPRSISERLFHIWLHITQPYTNRMVVQYVDEILSKLGW